MKKLVMLALCAGAFAAMAVEPGPLLVPDYNRDGVIDMADYDRLAADGTFAVWLNDDDDNEGAEADEGNGDTNVDLYDVPGGDGNDKDCEDDKVNGRCDLLDFFPVLVDVNGVDEWADYTWKLVSKSVNIAFTQLRADTAGLFHTQEAKGLDGETPLYRTEVSKLAEGDAALPDGFLKKGCGVILVEGAALGDEGLTLRGERGGSDPVEVTLKFNVKNVEDMYGWMNLRPKEGAENSVVRLPTTTTPSTTTDNRHFVLVHGYNVNHEEARGNAAEFYKKLWQSGSDAMFTAVEWYGDVEVTDEVPAGASPLPVDFSACVESAVRSSAAFAEAVGRLPGIPVPVGHGLGNVLIASAIREHGLDYLKFSMLDSAMPASDFDGGLPRTVNFYSPSDDSLVAPFGLPEKLYETLTNMYPKALPDVALDAGCAPVATLENVSLENFIGENLEWPLYEGEDVRTNQWRHSSFREVAFYHTSALYAALAAVEPPRVIVDTDLGSSMDDLFTVDLAARMHKAGKLNLMAVMMDRPDRSDVEHKGEFLTFADRYLASLGLGDMPIGTAMGQSKQGQAVFNPYWTLICSNNVTGVGLLLPTNRTPDEIASLTNAVALYRRLLKDAPDKSVVICSTGFLTNLEGLMKSAEDYEGDGSINASGMDLIAAKVKELRIMGGCFDYAVAPGGADGAEYNFAGDPAAAKMVVEGWPTPVVLSTWEVGLKLEYKPEDVLADFPDGTFDPVVRAAYTYWPEPLEPGDMNRLWDPMTVLPLTEGELLVPLSEMGAISVDGETGKTTFAPDPSGNRCYQVASNMNAVAVMDRYRAICRAGNPSVSADTVVYGTIRTAETTDYVKGAIAIKDGKYVYVGDEAGVAAFVEDGVTKVIDHRGKGMVMPGCTDGHAHYVNTFAMRDMKGGILFSTQDDKDTVLQKLSEATQKASDAGKKSLCGFGWNPLVLLGDKPSLTDLDEITHGVSTVIYDSSGHHAFCNSECLKRCKIIGEDGKTVLVKAIDGGVLELDDKGYPTGYVNERVTGYLTRMGGIDADELIDDEVAEAALRTAQELLLSTGYTTALDAWSNNLHPSKFYEVANRLDRSGDLKIVLPMTYEVEPWQTDMTNEIDCLVSLNQTYGTRHVLPEYLKLFMDGVVETMTGATIKPYGDGTFYKSFWAVDRLAEITANCNAKGLTVHAHTMGDAAVREAVDAYIQGGDGAHRNCLAHLRNVREEDFQRIATNNIACAAGLTWHTMDRDFGEMLSRYLNEEYVNHAYPIKSFFDAGVRASSHSDYPANKPSPQDPFGMMYVAVNGIIPDPGEIDYPFDTNELITVAQAFQALTLNGAWQLGLENERGSIKVGKWADFVLADQDVFACAVTDIGKTRVVSTWFEGEKVYPLPPSPPEDPNPATGKVTYPKADKKTGYLKAKSTATWKAKADLGCVFIGWEPLDGAKVPAAYGPLSANELKNPSLKLKIAADEGEILTNFVSATWAWIDEDPIGAVELTPTGLEVESMSYVTVSVSGLPSGLKFDKKTLAITGAAKKAGTKSVKVTVKNASGYTWKGTFEMTVTAGEGGSFLTEVTKSPTEGTDEVVRTGVAVLARGNAALGKTTGSKVYVAGKKASVKATPAKNCVFLGWYEDAEFANAATNLPKGYRTASQSVVVPPEGLRLYARYAELQAWTMGTFDGVIASEGPYGKVTFTVSNKGKVSGKLYMDGTTYSFAAKEIDDYLEEEGVPTFVVKPLVKKAPFETLTIRITEGEAIGLGSAEIFFEGAGGSTCAATAVQNGWKVKGKAFDLPAFGKNVTASVNTHEDPSYLDFKFGANGAVTVKGRLEVGKVSAKSQVLPVAWESEEPRVLKSEVCVYLPKKNEDGSDLCLVYEFFLTVGDDGKFGMAELEN